MTGDSSAPVQGFLTAQVLNGDDAMSLLQFVWVKLGLRAFKVSVLKTSFSAEHVLRHMESMCAQDKEGGETRS